MGQILDHNCGEQGHLMRLGNLFSDHTRENGVICWIRLLKTITSNARGFILYFSPTLGEQVECQVYVCRPGVLHMVMQTKFKASPIILLVFREHQKPGNVDANNAALNH